jgi:hypothetical protein
LAVTILERFFLRDEWSRNPGGAWRRSAGIAILWLLLGALLAFFNWIGSIGYFFVGVLWGLGALYAFRKGRRRQQERRDNCVHNAAPPADSWRGS